MSHFNAERYSSLSSPIHCWEPRVRLISLLLLIISIALAGNIAEALAGLVVSLLLTRLSRLPLSHAAGFMKWPFLFLLPLLVLLPFTAGGEPIFAFCSLKPTGQGLLLGIIFLIRGTGAALLALLVVATAPFTATINAFHSLGLPGSLTQIFLFAYRYIFLLKEELKSMSRSLDSRGFVKRSDLRTARMLALAVGMLFIRSYERSEDVFNAMLSRGYQGTAQAGSREEIRGTDILKGLLVVGAAFAIQAFDMILWDFQ
jgi:cobalt/nickel transport system permease protein